MCHGSLAPLTWCGLPPGLVGSPLLDAAHIKWPSAGNVAEGRHAHSSTMIDETRPICSISRPSSKRQAPVESESLPGICSPVPDIYVPAVSVQSRISSDVLSSCTGHAAAVSSQKSSVTGKNDGISGLMSHGSCAPWTFRSPPLGLVRSQFLDE